MVGITRGRTGGWGMCTASKAVQPFDHSQLHTGPERIALQAGPVAHSNEPDQAHGHILSGCCFVTPPPLEHCLVETAAGIAPHMRRKRQSAFASIWDNSKKLGSFCKKDQTVLHLKLFHCFILFLIISWIALSRLAAARDS